MANRILVVDDEPTVTEVVERYLVREGYEVASTADGADGLRLAREWAPNLIVLDLMLPSIDGLEVCRQLRRESQVPIIMLPLEVRRPTGWWSWRWAPTTTW